jgi:hypothetical protein
MSQAPEQITAPGFRGAWLVPVAVVVAIVAGFFAGFTALMIVSPSEWLGPLPGSFSPQGIDLQFVTNYFGVPLAAFVAALVAFVGVRVRRPLGFAIVGAAAGTVAYAAIGFDSINLGNWWLHNLPTDTNLTAGYLSALLCPPAILAILFCAEGALSGTPTPRRVKALQFVGLGAVLGLFVGALYGGEAAGVTWAISCHPYQNCFPTTTVIYGGNFVGSVIGLLAGVGTGFIAFLARI